jgi:hypothetical protein
MALCPIVGILRIIVDNVRHLFSVSYTIAAQFIGHYFSRLASMTTQ